MGFSLKNLTALVKVAMDHKASDIHIRTDEAPCLRINGSIVPIQTKNFSAQDVLDIATILTLSKVKVENQSELDGAYDFEQLCRVRYNFFRYNQKYGIILRLVNSEIPTIEDLGLSPSIAKICRQKRGLVLVTGATGSGKSTTLAAMINHINQNSSAHIVTVEDPVEFVHPQIKSRITQREIGSDTDDFSTALRAALRQDPDIILIGEMRDPETISIALKAAETGHLVLSTVHTTNASATIGRIIAMFPKEEQEYVQKRLAEHLYATISQRMLTSTMGDVVIAQEIMITSPGIRECIVGKESLSRLNTIIAQSKNNKDGVPGQSFDQHILELYQNGHISKETALAAVSSQADFNQKLLVE